MLGVIWLSALADVSLAIWIAIRRDGGLLGELLLHSVAGAPRRLCWTAAARAAVCHNWLLLLGLLLSVAVLGRQALVEWAWLR